MLNKVLSKSEQILTLHDIQATVESLMTYVQIHLSVYVTDSKWGTY